MSAGVDIVQINGRDSFRLYGFETRSAELQPEHRRFLRGWVRQRFSERRHYDIVGMASRLRFRESADPELNTDLSRRRARAVERAIIEFIMEEQRRRGAQGLLPIPNLDASVRGVGTTLSSDPDSDVNDEGHRAVLLIPGREVQSGQTIRITPTVPALSPMREFWIKYLGGGGGGEGVSFNSGGFIIRDANGYSQDYFYIGGGTGFGVPVSWADSLPPRQGWVRFTTRQAYRVDSFGGVAQISSGGVQVVDASLSLMILSFANGRGPAGGQISRNIPTGSGFTLAVGTDLAGALVAVPDTLYRNRWQYR